jgi:hypothetical protein
MVKPGRFIVNVKGTVNDLCWSFDESQPIYTSVTTASRFCLQNANLTSRHTVSNYTGIVSSWGLRLSAVSGVKLQTPPDLAPGYFGPGSVLQVSITPPLSTQQMYEHCRGGASVAFNLSALGQSPVATMTCNNVDANGNVMTTSMTPLQFDCLYNTSVLNATELASCKSQLALINITGMESRRRGTFSSNSTYPTSSSFVLSFSQLVSNLNPLDKAAFIAAVQAAWSFEVLAQTIVNSSPFPFLDTATLLNYTSALGFINQTLNASSLILQGVAQSTPRLTSVFASGVSVSDTIAPGATLSLTFNIETDIPSLNPSTNTLSRADIDHLFLFEPSIGDSSSNAYTGQWTSRSQLLITINHPTSDNRVVASPYVIDITFLPPLLANGQISIDPCIGVNICGAVGPSWGICNRYETSCRAFGTFYGRNITGSWQATASSSATITTSSSSFNPLYAILIVGLIALVALIIGFVYYRKKRSERREVSRVLRSWRAKFQPQEDKRERPLPATGEVWTRPPAMVSMRAVPDPFQNMSEQQPEKPINKDVSRPFEPRSSASIEPPSDPFVQSLLPPLPTPLFPAQVPPPVAGSLPPLKGIVRGEPRALPKLPPVVAAGKLPPMPTTGALPPIKRNSASSLLPNNKVAPAPESSPVPAEDQSTSPSKEFRRRTSDLPSFGVPAFSLPPARRISGGDLNVPGLPARPAVGRVDPFTRRTSSNALGVDNLPAVKKDPFARPVVAAAPAAPATQTDPSFVAPPTFEQAALPTQTRRPTMPKVIKLL